MNNRINTTLLASLFFAAALNAAPSSPTTNTTVGTAPHAVNTVVPVDKNLKPEWLSSLTGRGTPIVYRGAELRYIGMPVGGLFAGQLYLGGDGRLWNWDIFNVPVFTGADHYAHPMKPSEFLPLQQGFSLKIGDRTIPLDTNGFADVTFRGEYPIGTVRYNDPSVPLSVTLEAFSPFIPLDVENSSLPATIMRFTLANTSSAPVEASLSGSLENAVLLRHREVPGQRIITTVREKEFTLLDCSVKPTSFPAPTQPRADILIEDWNKETYEGWNVEGTAFGTGPILKSQIPKYQGDVGGDTERVVNSHSPTHSDAATGKLTGNPFLIDRDYLVFWVGGGNKPGKTGVNLLVDGKVVASATGNDENKLSRVTLDMRKFRSKQGLLEIIDRDTGPWGNVGVGRIILSDKSNQLPFEKLPDNGTMGLALLGEKADSSSGNQTSDLSEKLVGELGRTVRLAPGESTTVRFVLSWYFPNLSHLPRIQVQGRWYASKFDSALSVAR